MAKYTLIKTDARINRHYNDGKPSDVETSAEFDIMADGKKCGAARVFLNQIAVTLTEGDGQTIEGNVELLGKLVAALNA